VIRRTTAAVLFPAVLAAMVACSNAGSPGSGGMTGASPFAPCPVATSPSPQRSATGVGRPLPSVRLPCFTGGAAVDLAALGRPAVVNFWSSSCAPCRKEMPELQRFADAARGRVLVIGVDTADTRDAASAAGTDFGVSYPVLFDPRSQLLTAWGRNALPVTLLVDAAGTVKHEDVSGALTRSTLDQLSARYLGIAP
jgi:thiol-disulfide isomerase/thioredoxin